MTGDSGRVLTTADDVGIVTLGVRPPGGAHGEGFFRGQVFTLPTAVALQPPSVALHPPSVTLQPPSVTLQRRRLHSNRRQLPLKCHWLELCRFCGPPDTPTFFFELKTPLRGGCRAMHPPPPPQHCPAPSALPAETRHDQQSLRLNRGPSERRLASIGDHLHVGALSLLPILIF